jgi:hypothetical protein
MTSLMMSAGYNVPALRNKIGVRELAAPNIGTETHGAVKRLISKGIYRYPHKMWITVWKSPS